MGSLVYVRLIGFTAGTLLQLFWMVVILGYRRQRNFERVFFFLCLALFFFYSGSLLALNAQIYYQVEPQAVRSFAAILLLAGLSFVPPLLVHLHIEFAETRGMLTSPTAKRLFLVTMYAPVLYFGLHLYPLLTQSAAFNFLVPGGNLGKPYGLFLAVSMLTSSWWESRFANRAPDRPQRMFHGYTTAILVVGAVLVLYLHGFGGTVSESLAAGITVTLALCALFPSGLLIYLVFRYNFLQIGRQTNLVYAVSATFLALLYLSLVRRVSVWLEPALPPEASTSILLFFLVIFIEPLQRVLGKNLRETVHREMDRVQRVTAEIQADARQGDLVRLAERAGKLIQEEFELAEARLLLANVPAAQNASPHSDEDGKTTFPVEQGDRSFGVLRVKPHGAGLSGETRAALEFLCEQLPGALDLCRLIEEKLQLERELAEREKLAVLGQMAASISHNLKNPLGSIKTILQVQMENPELPQSIRGETKMVLEEIGRLSSKLNQLLQFSRPAVRGDALTAICDTRAVAEQVSGVLRHEAERRGVNLEVEVGAAGTLLAASAEAVSEILSNLVVNALEATARGGRVNVSGTANGGGFLFAVEDDGPGVREGLREKILQPFFTTKAQGTGLGLAIVARRVAEFGGKLDWESPVRDGHGTRFTVNMPMKEEKK
jgi:signal transduction histidine kinase